MARGFFNGLLIRNEEYEPAIEFFHKLVEIRPSYHIGWMRLGHAQRELAMRLLNDDPKRALELFNESVESLTKAEGHIDSARKSQAKHERSKAYYQLTRFNTSDELKKKCIDDARDAFQLSPNTSYESWIKYLSDHGIS